MDKHIEQVIQNAMEAVGAINKYDVRTLAKNGALPALIRLSHATEALSDEVALAGGVYTS